MRGELYIAFLDFSCLKVVLIPEQGCILLSDCGVMDGSCGLILGGIGVSPALASR
jgi:hypothetical protein